MADLLNFMNWLDFKDYLKAAVVFFAILSIPFALITGRYFDKLLKQKGLPYPPVINGILLFEISGRSAQYMAYILIDGPKKTKPGKYRSQYRNQIGDFSFRRNARLIDFIFIYMQLVPMLIIVIGIILAFIKMF